MVKEIPVSEEELVIIENALDEAREYLRRDTTPDGAILRDEITRAGQIVSSKMSSDVSYQTWGIWFTKVGFVQHHKKLIEDLHKVQDDRLKQFFVETQKPSEHQDAKLISQLNYDIRENAKLLSELGLMTPIGTNIKKRIIESYERMRSMGNVDPETGDISR
jgi:hypothetical protein